MPKADGKLDRTRDDKSADEHILTNVHPRLGRNVQATYDFEFIAPVEAQPVAGYSKGRQEIVSGKDGKAVEPTQTANYAKPRGKNLLKNTSITIGCNNVFGQDPPQASVGFRGSSTGYPGFIYDATGLFVYISLTKKF